MKHVMSTIIIALGCQVLLGQAKLEGTVRDADSGDPIAIATIALFQNGVLVTGTETDFAGYYSITEIEAGVYDVEFSTTGYIPSKVSGMPINSGKSNKLDKNLQPGIELIDVFTCCMCPPVIETDNTTQGHTFRMEEIRNFPFR